MTAQLALGVPDTRPAPGEGCTRLCRDVMLEAGRSGVVLEVTTEELFERCHQRWPDYLDDLSLREFHARHALPAKRALHEAGEL